MPYLLTLWSLAVLAIGGVLYLVMSRSSTSARAPTVHRPGCMEVVTRERNAELRWEPERGDV
jgi:hypothetical protein